MARGGAGTAPKGGRNAESPMSKKPPAGYGAAHAQKRRGSRIKDNKSAHGRESDGEAPAQGGAEQGVRKGPNEENSRQNAAPDRHWSDPPTPWTNRAFPSGICLVTAAGASSARPPPRGALFRSRSRRRLPRARLHSCTLKPWPAPCRRSSASEQTQAEVFSWLIAYVQVRRSLIGLESIFLTGFNAVAKQGRRI